MRKPFRYLPTEHSILREAVGSGGGIKAIQDQTVDFGASDAPMTDAQLKDAKGGALLHIPTALGAVVATYSIPGERRPGRSNA